MIFNSLDKFLAFFLASSSPKFSKLHTEVVRFLDGRYEVQVHERGDHTLHHTKHTVQPQSQQHQEEQHRPQLGHRELVDRLCERDEHEARTRRRLEKRDKENNIIIIIIWIALIYSGLLAEKNCDP